MRGYKHMDPNLADIFGSGASIQIATYAYYRAMEGVRGDSVEGRAMYGVPDLTPEYQHSPDHADTREMLGLPRDMSNWQFCSFRGNLYIHSVPPAYMFCCSTEPDERLIAEGQAVFEISDLELFAHRISRTTWGMLGHAEVGVVNYGPRFANPFEDGVLPEGPFEKSDLFADENEVRIVWESRIIREEYLRINSYRAAKLLRRIH